jgi:hypothetical protein
MKTKNNVSVLEERNTQICKEVVEEYHQNHSYYRGVFLYVEIWQMMFGIY